MTLILRESVNNALENAFGDRAGRIAGPLYHAGASRIFIVTDDRSGLPEGFRRTRPTAPAIPSAAC